MCHSAPYYERAQLSNLIVAGDGYAYLEYDYPELDTFCGDSMDTRTEHVTLLRVSSSGAYDKGIRYSRLGHRPRERGRPRADGGVCCRVRHWQHQRRFL